MKKNLFGVSLLTITCLYGVLSAFVILIFILTGAPVIYGILISIIILILQFLISPIATDVSMRWFYKAKFNYDMPDYLKNFIGEVCKKYNMKYPRIGYIDDGSPNAFTYGHTKNDARIVLTRGLFELLSEEEVKCVVAHELGHATHYDMLFMTVVQLVPLVLYGIYEIFTDNADDDDSSKLAIIGIIAYVLYIISQYIVLWLSRTREYYADSFAVEETKDPNGLALALVKIGFGLSVKGSRKKNTANALGIFDSKTSKALVVAANGEINVGSIKNAMKWEKWNTWAKIYELNSTHPLISNRLEAILSRAPEFGVAPLFTFDLVKENSYTGTFFTELVIFFLPFLTLVLTAIIACIFPSNAGFIAGLGGIVMVIFMYVRLFRSHKNGPYKETNVENLLGEVNVSGVTCIPVTLNGKIIGRGNPGCIFNEDFVIKDETGIMFLDYNQPIVLANKIFALFRSPEYFDKIVKIRGWYRRSPVPYVEILDMEVDGKVKKCHTFTFSKIIYAILMFVFFLIMIFA